MMSDTVQSILKTMQSEMKQVELISQNVANAQTPGYQAIKSAPVSFQDQLNTQKDLVKTEVSQIKGAIKFTGDPTHLALQGNGYFVIGRDSGDVLLTRSLILQTNENGNLVSQLGTEDLVDVSINVSDVSLVKVNESGQLSMNGKAIGQLSIVSVSEEANPKLNAKGLLQIDESQVSESKEMVMQGYQELSNVDSSQELIKLMSVSKHVESIQRSMLTIDQMMDSGINEIGK